MTLPPDDGGNTNRHDRLSPETIHAFEASLTIISAQSQMVRRWLRRTDVAGAEVVETRLAAIDATVERLCERLSDLDEPLPQDESGTSNNGQSGS